MYGGALTLDVEFYVADRIALLANLRERCLWGGDTVGGNHARADYVDVDDM